MTFRRLDRATMSALVVSGLVAAAIFASSGTAAKAPAPTIAVSFPTLTSASTASATSVPYNTPYVVSGCGYGPAGVTVVVHSPEAVSFAGQIPDAKGCISVSNFSTQGAGHYQVDAYQDLRKRSTRVATMSFDVI
jgi:hypothetical protein